MLIRPAEPDRDAAACAAIYAPFVRDTAVSFEEVPPTAEEFAQRISRLAPTHPFLVADEGAGAVGFAYGAPHRERAAYRWATDVAVYLAEQARGRGLGRALYTELLAHLAAQGFTQACGGIALPNPASVALHEALGFELVGVYRAIGFKAGAWRDVAWYQRDLRGGDGGGPPREPRPPGVAAAAPRGGPGLSSSSSASVGQASTARRASATRSGGTSATSMIG